MRSFACKQTQLFRHVEPAPILLPAQSMIAKSSPEEQQRLGLNAPPSRCDAYTRIVLK
jgi:hypothetical protein